MKKTITFLSLILISTTLISQEIDYYTARNKALEFFNTTNKNSISLKSGSLAQVDSVTTIFNNTSKSIGQDYIPLIYIFNRKDCPGFVFISADEKSKIILAYSYNNRIQEIPLGLEYLIKQYSIEIATIKKAKCENLTLQDFSNVTYVKPLLGEIEWDQEPKPYYTFCPNNTPAGCGAIAMAQILYHFKYPRNGIGSNSYNTDYGQLTVNFGNAEYKYELMSDSPAIEDNSEISKLCFHCGVSSNTKYKPDGSSTNVWNITSALKSNFDYTNSSCKVGLGFTESNWETMLRLEIDQHRPVIYRSADPNNILDPNDPSGGHIYIIDGYNELGFYHVNWGWSGCSNGYYSLSALQPNVCNIGYNFWFNHFMITGIEPSNPDFAPPQLMAYATNGGVNDNIILTFSEPINPNTLTNSSIIIQGEKSGIHTFPIANKYDVITHKFVIDPDQDFQYGEKVYITLKSTIEDLVGNKLDGDRNGTPGPDFFDSFNTLSFTHDYSVKTISLSNSNPLAGDVVVISAAILNSGKVTEPTNQNIYLFDNSQKIGTYSYFQSLAPNAERTQNFNWTATAGVHELKVEVDLAGDENSPNDSKSITVLVGVAGNLIIDGSQNSTKDYSLSEGKYIDAQLQIQNIGSATISGNIAKSGTSSSWISLSGGTTFSLAPGQSLPYNFRISVPASTAIGKYTAAITYTYDGGTKTNIIQLNINVVEVLAGIYPYDFNSGTVNIDGSWSKTQILMNTVGGSAGFYLDNNKTTTDPTAADNITYNVSIPDYNRMYAADWTTNVTEYQQSSSTSGIRISITQNSSKSNTIYASLNGSTDIMSWIVKGMDNTFKCALDNYVSDAANVKWFVSSSSPVLKFTTSGWGKECAIPSPTLTEVKAGWNKGRIYFKVDAVTTPGNLKLYNNGILVTTVSISSSDAGSTKYFSVTSSKTSTSNYYVIIGDPTNNTKVTISNIRLEITYFTGDPNLVCTKTLSKNKALVNESVDLSLLFNNLGSNISNNTSYNDSPLPSGISLISGSLSSTLSDILPSSSSTTSYTVKSSTPGIYNFGSSLVTYENQSRSKSYQTSFNAVSLEVSGGTLIVGGSINSNEKLTGESFYITANAQESITNSPVNDAIVKCSIRNTTKGTIFPPFFMVFNPDSNKYVSTFAETAETGTYEISITAQKEFYDQGSLNTPLQCLVKLPPYLIADSISRSANYPSGSLDYAIQSNVEWAVAENVDWLTCNKLNSTTLRVNYDANYTESNRSGSIMLTYGTRSFIITLSQENCYALIPTVGITLSDQSQSKEITVNSNSSWAVSSNQPWLKVSPLNGNNNQIISLALEQNTSTKERQATVTSTGCTATKSFTLTQEGAAPSLVVTPDIATVGSSATLLKFVVNSNVEWEVSSDNDWCIVAVKDGDTITATLDQNNTCEPRIGNILIQSSEIQSPTEITINQPPFIPAVPEIIAITHPTCDNGTGMIELASLPATGQWKIIQNTANIEITGSGTSKLISGLDPGTYSFIVSNEAGCSSLPTENQIINPQPEKPLTPVIVLKDDTLQSSTDFGNQWYCGADPIENADQKSYIPFSNGNYYVIVSQNGCESGPSNIISIDSFNGITPNGEKIIEIFPNPVMDYLHIRAKENIKGIDFRIINSIGQVVYTGTLTGSADISVMSFEDGVYLVKFELNGSYESTKFIKSK